MEKHWQQTKGQGTIVSVHRIQNPALHRRFVAEAKRHGGGWFSSSGLKEMVAYHGTRANAPALIYDSPTGFDMSCGVARYGSVRPELNGSRGRNEMQMSYCAFVSDADKLLCLFLLCSYLWFAQHASYSSASFSHYVSQRNSYVAQWRIDRRRKFSRLTNGNALVYLLWCRYCNRHFRSVWRRSIRVRVTILRRRSSRSFVCACCSAVQKIHRFVGTARGCASFGSRPQLSSSTPSLCACVLLAAAVCVCVQPTGGVFLVNQSQRCLPEYLITFQ